MKNRPKPNKAAYASNGTHCVKKSTDITPLEKNQVPLNMDELAKLQDPKPEAVVASTEQRNVKVKVLTKEATKAEVIVPKAEDAE